MGADRKSMDKEATGTDRHRRFPLNIRNISSLWGWAPWARGAQTGSGASLLGSTREPFGQSRPTGCRKPLLGRAGQSNFPWTLPTSATLWFRKRLSRTGLIRAPGEHHKFLISHWTLCHWPHVLHPFHGALCRVRCPLAVCPSGRSMHST